MQIYSIAQLRDWTADYLKTRPVHVRFLPSHILVQRMAVALVLWSLIKCMMFNTNYDEP